MNRYLLDTNVLPEFSRSTIPPNLKVKSWVESAQPDTLFTSVLSFGEIRKGIELLPHGKKRSELEQWLDDRPDMAGMEANAAHAGSRAADGLAS